MQGTATLSEPKPEAGGIPLARVGPRVQQGSPGPQLWIRFLPQPDKGYVVTHN